MLLLQYQQEIASREANRNQERHSENSLDVRLQNRGTLQIAVDFPESFYRIESSQLLQLTSKFHSVSLFLLILDVVPKGPARLQRVVPWLSFDFNRNLLSHADSGIQSN